MVIFISGVSCNKSWRECDYDIKSYLQFENTETNKREIEDSENLVAHVFFMRGEEWTPQKWDDILSGKLGKENSNETLGADITVPQVDLLNLVIENITVNRITVLLVDEPNKMFAWRTDEVPNNMHTVFMRLTFQKWKKPKIEEVATNGWYYFTESKWEMVNTDPILPDPPEEPEEEIL